MSWSPAKRRLNAPHKVQEYGEIFDARGGAYHEAMIRFPRAREAEFRNILDIAALEDGHTLCDYPSGGGYLETFLEHDVQLMLLETSKVFFQCAAENSRAERLLVQDGKIPLPDAHADRFISLAGLHHLNDKRPLFSEVYRCLKPSGMFALADTEEGSRTAEFLNGFVDEHSEEGHEGIFLHSGTKDELEECGYTVTSMRPIAYPWKFRSSEQMSEYCRLMFGITRATPEKIETAVRDVLGVTERDGEVHMRWELLFITAEKR